MFGTYLVHCWNNRPGLTQVFKVRYAPIRDTDCLNLAYRALDIYDEANKWGLPDLYTSSICLHVSCWFQDLSTERLPSSFVGKSADVSFGTSRL